MKSSKVSTDLPVPPFQKSMMLCNHKKGREILVVQRAHKAEYALRNEYPRDSAEGGIKCQAVSQYHHASLLKIKIV